MQMAWLGQNQDVPSVSDPAGPDVQLSMCEWMLSHVKAHLAQCLPLRFVDRDRVTRSEWELPPFHRHSTPGQREAKHDPREENMPALLQRFHCHELPSDLTHYHLGVVHDAVLDGDVTHHQTGSSASASGGDRALLVTSGNAETPR